MAALRRTGSALNTSLCIALRSRTSHQFHTAATLHNSNRVSIGRSGRTTFLRSYPVLLVQPDGSTITVQYKEPRKMLIMPIDITTLSEEERKARLRQRNQSRRSGAKKEKDEYEEVILDEYSQFWRKK